jgi:hypothetical protein
VNYGGGGLWQIYVEKLVLVKKVWWKKVSPSDVEEVSGSQKMRLPGFYQALAHCFSF